MATLALGIWSVPRAVWSQTPGDATSVQGAMKQTERRLADGFNRDYKLEFGDTDDWIRAQDR